MNLLCIKGDVFRVDRVQAITIDIDDLEVRIYLGPTSEDAFRYFGETEEEARAIHFQAVADWKKALTQQSARRDDE